MRSIFNGVVAVIIAASFLTACSKKENEAPALPPPIVSAITIKKQNFPFSFSYVGVAEGSKAVEVKAQVSGILKSRLYEEGSHVMEGQLLFEIEPDTYIAALEQAKASLAQAQAKSTQAKQNYDRVAYLYKKNAISQLDYDNAKASYAMAKAEVMAGNASVADAQIKLGWTKVVSPVSGFSGKANMSIGNLVNAASENGSLLTIVNRVNPIYVNFSVSDAEFNQRRRLMEEGRLISDNVTASLSDSSGRKILEGGKIDFIDKRINDLTGDISARAQFVNDNLTIMPGQFLTVIIVGQYLKDAILIPQKAIVQTQQTSMVIVLEEGNRAEYRPVTVSDNIGEYYLVDSGLAEGDRVVVEGTNKVRPGQVVRLTASENR